MRQRRCQLITYFLSSNKERLQKSLTNTVFCLGTPQDVIFRMDCNFIMALNVDSTYKHSSIIRFIEALIHS